MLGAQSSEPSFPPLQSDRSLSSITSWKTPGRMCVGLSSERTGRKRMEAEEGGPGPKMQQILYLDQVKSELGMEARNVPGSSQILT